MDFCVYLHRRKTDGQVFYVGKGTIKRSKTKYSRNAHWQNIADKHGYFIEIVESGLQEWYALELEVALISYYGRIDQKKGTLANYTDGGEGSSGRPVSLCTRKKMSDAQKGKKMSHSAKLKAISTRKLNDQYRKNLNHKKVIVYKNDGARLVFESHKKACEILKLDFRNFSAVCRRKRKIPKAWLIDRIENVNE